MGGQQSGGSGGLLPKAQVIEIIAEFKQTVMPRMLEEKKANIEQRMQHYKRNLEEYKNAVVGFMPKQQQILQETMVNIIQAKGVSMNDFNFSVQRYMGDPEVQPSLIALRTLSADFCEGQPVPEDLNRDRFLEMVRLQTEEMRKYPIANMMDSMLAQTAAADEIYQQFGYDEVTIAAAAIKFETLDDPELAHAREEWNEASRQEELSRNMQQQIGQGHTHMHGDKQCSHDHSEHAH